MHFPELHHLEKVHPPLAKVRQEELPRVDPRLAFNRRNGSLERGLQHQHLPSLKLWFTLFGADHGVDGKRCRANVDPCCLHPILKGGCSRIFRVTRLDLHTWSSQAGQVKVVEVLELELVLVREQGYGCGNGTNLDLPLIEHLFGERLASRLVVPERARRSRTKEAVAQVHGAGDGMCALHAPDAERVDLLQLGRGFRKLLDEESTLSLGAPRVRHLLAVLQAHVRPRRTEQKVVHAVIGSMFVIYLSLEQPL